MKRGKPIDEEITNKIYEVIKKDRSVTIEGIKRKIFKEFNKNYSWNTIRNHVDKLISNKQVIEDILSEDKRKVSIIRGLYDT